MSNMNNKRRKKELSEVHKNLARNTFYAFFNNYSRYIFTLITSFIIARIITPSLWGYLVLALSYITLFSLILSFLPPSLGLSFNYYIPRYKSLNQNTKLKSFIKISLAIRSLFVLAIFIISLLIFRLFTEIIRLNLESYLSLIYILSPLIIINGLGKIFNDLNRSLSKFKIVFILLVVRYSIEVIGLLSLYLFIDTVKIESIALVALLSSIIPFVLNCLIIIRFQLKIEKTEEEGLSFNQVYKKLLQYGSFLSISDFVDNFYREFKTQAIGFFESSEIVIGYNIALHYSNISRESVVVLNRPLTISFSSLDVVNKQEQIEKIYKVLFQYSVFLFLLITGVLYFFIDIFIVLVYGDSYLTFSLILKIMMISIILNIIGPFFYSRLRASNKVKYIVPISLGNILIRIPLFLFGLIFFNVIGAILGLLIANIITFIIFIYLSFVLFKIELNISKIIRLYTNFIIALGISLLLAELILTDLNFLILKTFNLLFFQKFEILTLITFIFIFIFLTLAFKIFSIDDIENIEALFKRDNIIHKLIRRGLNVLKKFC